MATDKADFELAQQCLQKANDFGGQLLLATSSGMGALFLRRTIFQMY